MLITLGRVSPALLALLAVSLFFAVVFNMILYLNAQAQKSGHEIKHSLLFSTKDIAIFALHFLLLGLAPGLFSFI